ncbi:antitoxin Xre/MbcA/ParS-like domain-containing protein [Acidisoma sp. 7E03]
MGKAARSRTLLTVSRKHGSAVKDVKTGSSKALKPAKILAKKIVLPRAGKNAATIAKKAAAVPVLGKMAVKSHLTKSSKLRLVRGKTLVPARQGIKPGGDSRDGAGLGELLRLEEGQRQLDAYGTPTPLESWAGPVAGAGDIQRLLGVPRQTLSNWRLAKAAIGLLKGQRNLAYPLDQFVDGRPVEGLARIVEVAPSARAAWLWLRQPHAALGGKTPLSVLKHGQAGTVALVAERDFL